MPTAAEIIATLKLEPLPNEGGFFRQTYVSTPILANGRAAGTAIYFLITPDGFSALHLLETDEIWHFYAGDPVEHVMLDDYFDLNEKHILGSDPTAGQHPQLIVPPHYWQGARLAPGPQTHGWALLGCTMSPGWDEQEFKLGDRDTLIAQFPAWASDIRALTR
ncbi:cupin domain-containing protein [Rariglobus hedericola]|uniref:Cupin domain-containing protein n=1 Tax=Rariglobus hedericola TaxID=2597822 RepID=A0A556QGT7_9BACT|nr:cupin domain-containing protein [Rariglobus hedericola]TSJ75856.1 cupin domain-containing protein [Rariglobus hedericola]